MMNRARKQTCEEVSLFAPLERHLVVSTEDPRYSIFADKMLKNVLLSSSAGYEHQSPCPQDFEVKLSEKF